MLCARKQVNGGGSCRGEGAARTEARRFKLWRFSQARSQCMQTQHLLTLASRLHSVFTIRPLHFLTSSPLHLLPRLHTPSAPQFLASSPHFRPHTASLSSPLLPPPSPTHPSPTHPLQLPRPVPSPFPSPPQLPTPSTPLLYLTTHPLTPSPVPSPCILALLLECRRSCALLNLTNVTIVVPPLELQLLRILSRPTGVQEAVELGMAPEAAIMLHRLLQLSQVRVVW